MQLITWVWVIIIVIVFGFVIYYLLKPIEEQGDSAKESSVGETEKEGEEKLEEENQKEENNNKLQT